MTGSQKYAVSAVVLLLVLSGCKTGTREHSLQTVDSTLELETRLQAVQFSLVESEFEAIRSSWMELGEGSDIPASWNIRFAGTDIEVANPDPAEAFGVIHENGRITCVYTLGEPVKPDYGEILPLAVAHYMIPEQEFSLLLLLVTFQSDPDGSNRGIGVRSVDTDGIETSAPFAIALDSSQLSDFFFYGDFIESDEKYSLAARGTWDRGFLLLTKLTRDNNLILSTYLPWY